MSLHVLAAAPPASGGVTMLLVALGLLAVYLLSVWINPFAPCRRCKGSPRTHGSLFTKAYDVCRHCEGRGRRVRTAARLFPRNRDVK